MSLTGKHLVLQVMEEGFQNLEISWKRMAIALAVGLVAVVQALTEAESIIVHVHGCYL